VRAALWALVLWYAGRPEAGTVTLVLAELGMELRLVNGVRGSLVWQTVVV